MRCFEPRCAWKPGGSEGREEIIVLDSCGPGVEYRIECLFSVEFGTKVVKRYLKGFQDKSVAAKRTRYVQGGSVLHLTRFIERPLIDIWYFCYCFCCVALTKEISRLRVPRHSYRIVDSLIQGLNKRGPHPTQVRSGLILQ